MNVYDVNRYLAKSVGIVSTGLIITKNSTSKDEVSTLVTISCAASQPRATAISAAISVERRAVKRAVPTKGASIAGATAGREINRAKHSNGDKHTSTSSRNISAAANQSPEVSRTASTSFLSSIADHSFVSSLNCVVL